MTDARGRPEIAYAGAAHLISEEAFKADLSDLCRLIYRHAMAATEAKGRRE